MKEHNPTSSPHLCAIYARTSKEDKAQKKCSIEQQIYDAKSLAEKNGYTVLPEHIYIDRDVTSRYPPEQFRDGIKSKIRPSLTKLITAIQEKKVDALFIRSYDRIFRFCQFGLRFMDILYKSEIDLFATHDPVFTRDASGKFALTVVMASYEMQLNKIRTDIKASVEYRKTNHLNLCGARSIGYDNLNKNIVINESEALIVKEIFNKFLSGVKIIDITKWMNTDYKDKCFGKKWYHQSIVRILRFTGYINEAIQPYPQIVDKDIWLQAQKMLSLRKNTRTGYNKKQHLSTNFFTCGYCGSTLKFRYRIERLRKDKSRNVNGYYYCDDCNKVPNIQEKYYLDFIENVIASAKLNNEKKDGKDVVDLEIQKDRIQKNKDDLVSKFSTGELDLDKYTLLDKSLTKQNEKVDKQISDIRAMEVSTKDIKEWKDMIFDEKRDHISRVVEFIKVTDKGVFLRYKPVVAVDIDTILDNRLEDVIYFFPVCYRVHPKYLKLARCILPEDFKKKLYGWKIDKFMKKDVVTPSYID